MERLLTLTFVTASVDEAAELEQAYDKVRKDIFSNMICINKFHGLKMRDLIYQGNKNMVYIKKGEGSKKILRGEEKL